MKNWINKIPKEKLQKYAFLGMLVLVFAAFFISLAFIGQGEKPNDNNAPTPQNPDNGGGEQPTIKEVFVMPIEGNDYVIVKKFYDIDTADEEQQKYLIRNGGQYINSKGISITNKDKTAFDVLCSMSGVVTSVKESPLYGYIVTVEHDEDIVTEYSSLSSVKVKVGDVVKQKDVLGTSGVSEYDDEGNSHVHFKVSKNNVEYNPEKIIGKLAKDVK